MTFETYYKNGTLKEIDKPMHVAIFNKLLNSFDGSSLRIGLVRKANKVCNRNDAETHVQLLEKLGVIHPSNGTMNAGDALVTLNFIKIHPDHLDDITKFVKKNSSN